MAYSDLELAYLLTAHGQKVYALAMGYTNHKGHALAITQKVFLELVCFPPILKENQTKEQWLMAYTKKLSKSYPKAKAKESIEPLSEEDEEELLALMKEARDHDGILQKPTCRWKPIHTVAISITGAFLAIILLLVALFGGGGATYTDEQGSTALLPATPSNQQTEKEEPTPLPPPIEEDPLPPDIINNSTCETYTKLSDFAKAIDEKVAAGYGENYYTARSLLLLPNRLPDEAVFRCLYLEPQTGNYSYSFRFEYEQILYLLEFKVESNLPATAMEVSQFTAAIQEEQVTRTLAENTLTYTFGNDRVTAILTAPKSDQPIEPTLAKDLLSYVILERCSPINPFLQH